MTTADRIEQAWKNALLRQNPVVYRELIDKYLGKSLYTEQIMLFEELYSAGIVERYNVRKDYKTNTGEQSYCFDVRYRVEGKEEPLDNECRECERLIKKIAELEAMLEQKTRYREAV